MSCNLIQFYNSAFNPANDPYWANVAMLLRFDEVTGSTVFADVKGNAIVNNGSPKISRAVALASDGVLDATAANTFLTIQSQNFAFGTDDFTIEGFTRFTQQAGNGVSKGVLNIAPATSGLGDRTNSIAINQRPDTLWEIYANGNQWNASSAPVIGQTYHYAMVRKNGTTTLYINGQAVITVTGDTMNYTGTYMALGCLFAPQHAGLGFHDEVRVTKGIARYSGNFTVPTSAYPGQ